MSSMSTSTSRKTTEAQKDVRATVVVAGAERGIGKATCVDLARLGANVAILYKESKKAPEFAEKLQKEFPEVKVRAYQCDPCDPNHLKNTLKHIEQDLGEEITGLVIDFGYVVTKPALRLTHDDFQKTFGVNVFAVSNICCAIAQLWIDNHREGGSIVTIGSISSKVIYQAGPNKPVSQAFFYASMAALEHMTHAFAAEWAEKNIRANVLLPGYVEDEEADELDKEILRHQRENVPLRRFGKPHDYSAQVVALVTSRNDYRTGASIHLDGGLTLF